MRSGVTLGEVGRGEVMEEKAGAGCGGVGIRVPRRFRDRQVYTARLRKRDLRDYVISVTRCLMTCEQRQETG